MPKVTVLMPVYNAAKFLRDAVGSILKQSFSDFEFLIIDDGSTDGSQSIISSYKDSRIKFVQNEKNFGVAKTLNRGLDLSRGEYIARMDAEGISNNSSTISRILNLGAWKGGLRIGCENGKFFLPKP